MKKLTIYFCIGVTLYCGITYMIDNWWTVKQEVGVLENHYNDVRDIMDKLK